MFTKIFLTIALLILTIEAQQNNKVFKGILGRQWIVGGKFGKAHQVDGKNITAQNLAKWNGTHWETFGTDFPNNNVKVIETDLCRNVYIGGSFTAVGSKTSGPVARWNTGKKLWEQIGTKGDVTWNTGAVVNDIAVNCRNIPTSLGCPCSVYVVGKFVATIKDGGSTATNAIKYDFSSKKWTNLGGTAKHGMGTGEVFSVYSKQAGLTGAIYIVWFAGSFTGKFQRLQTQTNKWGFADSTLQSKINGDIKHIYYKTETGTTTDKVYLSGNFTGLGAVDGTCQRVCYFNYKTEKFYVVGKSNIPNDVVNYVELSLKTVYIGGAFTNTGSKYVAKLGTSGAWEKIASNDATVITKAVSSIDVCNPRNGQIDCGDGSTSVVGGNQAKYYDAKSKLWTDFGKGVDGIAETVTSQFSSAKTHSFGLALMVTLFTVVFLSF